MDSILGQAVSDVRLVIWDLDETFWRGTLSEGGITQYVREHHDLVIELAGRGIMSSICSKNDHETVKGILIEAGSWDYFIFPSISWLPKGERLRTIVDLVQLRPRNVLFVDDNHGNRAEAKTCVPEIQVADSIEISLFLDDPRFKGKPDRDLTRLKQYKLLEERSSFRESHGGNNIQFLCDSNIVVTIDYDVETNLDRAIELINRTNQVNFTKVRLSDDLPAARKELLEQISPFHARAGLIQVKDRFGDYGYCGFFLVTGLTAWNDLRLVHFAFSCRVLGMGVEQWVYNILGRPRLDIVGEVVSDLTEPVDWINKSSGDDRPTDDRSSDQNLGIFGEVRIRGGCELEVLEHFFRAHSTKVRVEFNSMSGLNYVPIHNSSFFHQSLQGIEHVPDGVIEALRLPRESFHTTFFDPAEDGSLLIYSPTGEGLPTYKHRHSDLCLAVWLRECCMPSNPHRTEEEKSHYENVQSHLRSEFEEVLLTQLDFYESLYRSLVTAIPCDTLMIVVLPNYLVNVEGSESEWGPQRQLNELFRRVASGMSNVTFIAMTDLIESIDDVDEGAMLHFRREIYYRLFLEIGKAYRHWQSARIARRALPAEFARR